MAIPFITRYTLDGKPIEYSEEQIEAYNNPYGGYTVGGGTPTVNYNAQPGFTASAGNMGYNIPSAGQGVSSYNIGQDMSTDMTNPFTDYLPQEFLETTPSAAFYSSPTATDFYTRPSGTIDPSKKRFYQDSFQDIYNEYLGRLGTMAREGETPNLRFTDYLSQADPFTERYERLTPYQRGMSRRAFAPSTRFIYY